MARLAKNYSDSYLFNVNSKQYEKILTDFLLKGERIDKKSEAFADLRYEIKRREVSPALMKVLDSNAIVLMTYPQPLPKAFRVFCAKDIADGSKKLKVFIDCDVVYMEDGKYKCKNPDILIAYLVSAMTTLIYYKDPKRLINREEVVKGGAECFSNMFVNVIDYLCKISGNGDDTRDKLVYVTCLYYQVCILGKDLTDGVYNVAKKMSGLSDIQMRIINSSVDEADFRDIKTFVDYIKDKFRLGKLTLEVVLDKWIYLYGVGTQFALELFPPLAQMLSNAYVGCYLNNQKTIEKICGKALVAFTNGLLKVGGESV